MAARLVTLYRYLAMAQMIKGESVVTGVSETSASSEKLHQYLRKIRFFQRMAKIRPGVEVAVRVRPMNQRELQLGQDPCVFMRGGRVLLTSGDGLRVEPFDFDYALDSSCDPRPRKFASQKKVYNELGEDVVEDVVEGVNVTVLAYGQTSSGKTHTMFGPPGLEQEDEQQGLIPRILQQTIVRLNEKVLMLSIST